MEKNIFRKVIVLFTIGSLIITCIVPSITCNKTHKEIIQNEQYNKGLFKSEISHFLKQTETITKILESNDAKKNEEYFENFYNPKNVDNKLNTNKKWTWIFYDDADFYRAYDPLQDFSDEAYSNENLNVIVLQDKEHNPAKMWYIDENHDTILLENMGEINMGDYQTLKNFIEYSKIHYPANRYILSFYNHGGGWKGVCWDDTSNDHLTMDEVQKALTNTGGIDIICNTAPCLMGALESAYELRDCVDVYIGSEEGSGYGHWWGTIEKMCDIIYENPDLSNNEFGEYIIQSIWNETPWQESITMSAVKTDKLEPLVSSLDLIASDFITYYNESYDLFWDIYDNIQSFGGGFCIDLYDFTVKCSNVDFNQVIIQGLLTAMDCFQDVIINECHGDYPGANGLTIYIPDITQFSYESQYGASEYGLDFAQNSNWDEFINIYCAEVIEPDVDQFQTETTTGMVICSYFIWSQSFKPSIETLKKVELKLVRFGMITSDLTVSIRKNKDGEDLTIVSIPYDRVPTDNWKWISFNFPDITIIPNETYYILLSTHGGDNIANFYTWAGNTDSDSYPNGEVWIQFTSSNDWKIWDPPIDSCFKTFFEDSYLNPPTISGPLSGETGIKYEYTFIAYEPNNLDISYYIDWGDGMNSGWIGPYSSGEGPNISHTWNNKGLFIIKAKAKNSEGVESDWAILEISMPKNRRNLDLPILRLLYNYQFLFSLLRLLQRLQ
jgi:hypothetical protein